MYLAIDTFSEILGIAVFDKSHLIVLQEYYRKKPFSEFLTPKLEQILDELSLSPEEFKGVVVNRGPGSYTGIRVGVTVAKTLAYSLNIPIYAFRTNDAIAYRYRFFKGNIVVLINAGKGEVYISEYVSKSGNVEVVSDISLKTFADLELIESEDTLIIYKNLDIRLKNSVELKESIVYDGSLYALKNSLLEDRFKLEPLYIRGI